MDGTWLVSLVSSLHIHTSHWHLFGRVSEASGLSLQPTQSPTRRAPSSRICLDLRSFAHQFDLFTSLLFPRGCCCACDSYPLRVWLVGTFYHPPIGNHQGADESGGKKNQGANNDLLAGSELESVF